MRLVPNVTGLVLICSLATAGEGADPGEQWPAWRGPLGTGVGPSADPPLRWSEDHNVRWKVSIPGRGQSTPIVWGDRVFVTTAVPYGEAREPGGEQAPGAHHNQSPRRPVHFKVLAIGRGDGTVLWERTVRSAMPNDSRHVSGSWASGSAVTDGERLFAFFGSAGLYALTLDGEPVWQADLGRMRVKHGHGEGSSPALHGDTLVINWDHEGDSFIVALDKRTGKQRWKVARDEATSWSTPLIVSHAGRSQVIVAATRRVRAYDLANGNLIWECGGLSGNVVASPVAASGLVFVANSYETRAMLAIRLDRAKGDITGTDAVAWTRGRDTPYVPSPLLYDGALCFLKHYQGLLTCVQAADGKPLLGPRRLPGVRNVYASPVGAAGRIYIVDLDGTTAVLERGGAFEVLAVNRLDDSFAASPAAVGEELYLRGERSLYCIAQPRK